MSNPFFSEVPPPLPPKPTGPPRRQHQPTHQPTRSNTRTDPSYAHHPSRSNDAPPRTRPSRSQTAGLPSSATNTSSRPQPPQARRSHSTDSTPSDKVKSHRSKAKKSSIHADVIDRLDFTGVGPMFHHDGPFDACAPSRNRHRTQAPMYAWTSINAEDEAVAARYREKEDASNTGAPTLTYDRSYPPEPPRSPPVAASYSNYYVEPPKQKVDALAEAWGMHEPEPYEEFFAGGGDPDGPVSNASSTRDARSNGRRTREDLTSRPRGSNRLPPPQPIFVGKEPEPDGYFPQPSPGSGGGANISRNKSIMQRIRRMRDSPNVPVGFDETLGAPSDGAPSPTSSTGSSSRERPAQRRGDSLLGRFTRGGRGNTSPPAPVEPYVYDDRAKELPATPRSPADPYSDGPSSPGNGLGRKTSILQRVRGVVRGNK